MLKTTRCRVKGHDPPELFATKTGAAGPGPTIVSLVSGKTFKVYDLHSSLIDIGNSFLNDAGNPIGVEGKSLADIIFILFLNIILSRFQMI